jgi:hypothetical protein
MCRSLLALSPEIHHTKKLKGRVLESHISRACLAGFRVMIMLYQAIITLRISLPMRFKEILPTAYMLSGCLLVFASCQAQYDLPPSKTNPSQPSRSTSTQAPSPSESAAATLAHEEPDIFVKTGIVESDLIRENSGLARSHYLPDAFWCLNDSGNSSHVFCVSLEGKLLAKLELEGVQNRDWESMTRVSIPQGHFLIVGEVGDNISQHSQCHLFFFPEPEVEKQDEPVSLKARPLVISFVYQDGPRDCEAIAIDPVTNDLWLFEKIMQFDLRRKPGIYRLPAAEWLPRVAAAYSDATASNRTIAKDSSHNITVKRIGNLNHRFVTGADFSPDGLQLILSTYTHALHFSRTPTQEWADVLKSDSATPIPLPIQRQCEAILFTPDSQAVIVTSEFVRQPIWKVEVAKYLKFHQN